MHINDTKIIKGLLFILGEINHYIYELFKHPFHISSSFYISINLMGWS